LHDYRAAVDVHVQFQLLFEQFHVLEFIHSSVRRNEIQTSSATARHGGLNHLTRQVCHCGYNIFLVKTLTQWPSNAHVARGRMLHGAFLRKQHFLSFSDSLMAVTSGKFHAFSVSSSLVLGMDLVPACGTSVEILCSDVWKQC